MRLAGLKSSMLAAIVVGVVSSVAPAVVEAENVFDKLKKQVKDSASENKKKAKQTVEEEAGISSSQSPDSMRADLTQKWQACYDSMLASPEYKSCASICNMARQSIADFDGAAKTNQATWQRCSDSYDKAKASAPALQPSAKEKKQSLPAGALAGADKATTVDGVDASSPSSLRADTERMRSECHARRETDRKFNYCSNRCSISSQKISDAGNAATNTAAWQECKKMYDAAISMGKALDAQAPASQSKPAVSPTPVATTAPAISKPAAKPMPTSSLTATAADKAAADKYGQGCAGNYHLSGTYDCQCMRNEYLAASLLEREEAIKTWETQTEPYLRNQLETAKANGKPTKFVQERYDEGKASAYGTPETSHVSLRLESRSAKCYSRANVIKTQKTECLVRQGKTTPGGTPIDDKYCSCYAEKYASQLIDEGKTGAQVTSPATLACDTESPLYKLQKKK